MNEQQPPNPEVERGHEAIPRAGPEAPPLSNELDRSESPRIYVASLSDYNDGRLHGRWIDAHQEAERLQQAITDMLAASPMPGAEEWAIHDYEGWGPLSLGEWESVETISQVANGIVTHGPAFAHWAALLDRADWGTELSDFEECFRGTWSSMQEYAAELLDDLGFDLDELGPEKLRPYISFDIEAFARDLSFDHRISKGEEGVHVFNY